MTQNHGLLGTSLTRHPRGRAFDQQREEEVTKMKCMSLVAGLVLVGLSVMAAGADGIGTINLLATKDAVDGQILYEMRIVDAAMEQYGLSKNLPAGTKITWQDIKPFISPKTRLGMLDAPVDLLGNPIDLPVLGETPRLAKRTVEILGKSANDRLWAGFMPK